MLRFFIFCFFALCVPFFLPPAVFIAHSLFQQYFLLLFFPSLSCKAFIQPSCHPFPLLISHSFHTSLWLHFLSVLTFHPNSIPFILFTRFITLFLTLLSPRPSFSYIISLLIQPALRATCTSSFPDLEKIDDPTDAILSMSCILSLLFPTMESWQPQRETWNTHSSLTTSPSPPKWDFEICIINHIVQGWASQQQIVLHMPILNRWFNGLEV